MERWIKISSAIYEHWIYDKPHYLKWWIDLLLLAEWKDNKRLVGRSFVTIKRGQLVASVRFLCKRWEYMDCYGRTVRPSEKTVHGFLKLLKDDGMIETDNSVLKNKETLVTICNYAKYQALNDGDIPYGGNTLDNTLETPCDEIGNTFGRKSETPVTRSKSKGKTPISGVGENTLDNTLDRNLETNNIEYNNIIYNNSLDLDNCKTKSVKFNQYPSIFGKIDRPTLKVEERQKEFYQSLIPSVKKYGKEMIRAFYNYWSKIDGEFMEFERIDGFTLLKALDDWYRNGEPKPQEPFEEIDDELSFDAVWDLYDKKVGPKDRVRAKWYKLSKEVRKSIMEYIPRYKASQPDKRYRKNFETFLNQKGWEDELITSTEYGNKETAPTDSRRRIEATATSSEDYKTGF